MVLPLDSNPIGSRLRHCAMWTAVLLGILVACNHRLGQNSRQREFSAPIANEPNMPHAQTRVRFVPISDPRISVMGRVDRSDPKRMRIGYPGVTLRVASSGPYLRLRGGCTSPDCQLSILVDETAPRVLRMPKGSAEIAMVEDLAPGVHHVDIVRRTEHWQGVLTVEGLLLDANGELSSPKPWPERKLMFIGDSVTSGEGVDRARSGGGTGQAATSDAYGSYGMLLGRALNAQCHLVSYGGRGLVRSWDGKRDVVSAPQFFELSIPDEAKKEPWDHAAYVPDAIVISLGTNDFALAIGAFPTQNDFVGTYIAFLRRLRSLYPSATILLTEGSILHDRDRDPKRVLRAYIDETVKRMGDPKIIALRANHYPGDADNAHPTGEQHVMMARDFEPEIRRIMGW